MAYKLSVEWGVGGLVVDNHRTTLPLKRGLSSSAAFCVLLARAFNMVYSLGLTVRGEMAVAYEGERLTPSHCGRMDQAVALGKVTASGMRWRAPSACMRAGRAGHGQSLRARLVPGHCMAF